ncbi:MAG: right-handed parallel beta-helix repeat-containing protein, partial [Deltaproteobacteria bacterium]|nr:right-handed parallel beta-helix repeat-containing protein [Deltaproteobacteria bacterium]
ILLEAGHYRINTLFVADSVSLIGESGAAETVVEPKDEGALLKIYGGNEVLVRGLTLRGGRAEGGGAIEVSNDASVTVEDCVFEGNQADQFRGGGVYAFGEARLELYRCLFVNNRCERGGALAAGDTAKLWVDRCVFSDNDATLGGALWVSDTAEATVRSSTFVSNRAAHPTGGEALFVTGERDIGPQVVMVNTLIAGKRAVVNNPERPGKVSLAHCVVPPDTLAGGTFSDGGDNLEVQAELVLLRAGLWCLRPGSAGAGTAHLEQIPADALDLLGRPLVRDGAADPGALAAVGDSEDVTQYTHIEG